MRFSVLGPLLAHADDGTPLTLTRRSQRETLSVLLMHTQRPPTRAFLIDALWGDDLPRDAETALRVRMRDLRRTLGGHGRLVTHQSGYRMVIEAGEFDVASFHDLAARGRAALDSGRAYDAARLFGKAINLWRDPPLVDLPDTAIMRLAANALLEECRDVQEWLIDARLALGQERDVLAHIRAAIAADPLAEHAHVQLMVALYRCGQKSAALAAYSKLRDLTSHEFGQDPGPEAQTLLEQILRDSPDLKFRPTSLTPASGATGTLRTMCETSAGASPLRRQRGGRGSLFRCPHGTVYRHPPSAEPGAKTG
jgi:DNA-binding SARP family transcriptional activator